MLLDTKEVHLSVGGRIDAHKAPELRRQFEALHAEGKHTIYLNTEAVSFIDSSGLAAIVSALKTARTHGGEFYLLNPSEAVSTILNYTMLDQVIPIKTGVAS